jgi:glycosyltransferase involved in cell wall biosynthesis
MDIFHKIRALHASGVRVHLHCFTRGEKDCGELKQYCSSIDLYPRKGWPSFFHLHLPYIVSTRISSLLEKRLLANDHPILAEGIHASYLLTNKKFSGRKCFLRLHNAEWVYYASLGRIEKNIFRKAYFFIESFRLHFYEKKIARRLPVFCVSRTDMALYQNVCNAKHIDFLPVFHGFHALNPGPQGDFCLYHGNLAINENEKAVRWLLRHVFSKAKIPFVVAGRAPSESLRELVNAFPSGSILADPSDEQLDELIRNAQVHVLPSFNQTGIKLKLLHALFVGRHCLVNPQAAAGSGLEKGCFMEIGPDAFREKLIELFSTPYSDEVFSKRKALLDGLYDNERNVRLLMQWIY